MLLSSKAHPSDFSCNATETGSAAVSGASPFFLGSACFLLQPLWNCLVSPWKSRGVRCFAVFAPHITASQLHVSFLLHPSFPSSSLLLWRLALPLLLRLAHPLMHLAFPLSFVSLSVCPASLASSAFFFSVFPYHTHSMNL